MTRAELLGQVIRQAGRNGFDFKHWRQRCLGAGMSEEAAIEMLAGDRERRYFSLLFSHEFASAFWKQGSQIAFVVPSATYTRRGKDGKTVHVHRKPYTRRKLKPDAWKYHLREMACCEEPLRYMRRFIVAAAEVESAAAVASQLDHRLAGKLQAKATLAARNVASGSASARNAAPVPAHARPPARQA
jgi:hypothetical protein